MQEGGRYTINHERIERWWTSLKGYTGIALYRNGAKIDNSGTDLSYTAMENKGASCGSYILHTDGTVVNPFIGKQYMVMIVAETLTAAQVVLLDTVMRGYAGVAL